MKHCFVKHNNKKIIFIFLYYFNKPNTKFDISHLFYFFFRFFIISQKINKRKLYLSIIPNFF